MIKFSKVKLWIIVNSLGILFLSCVENKKDNFQDDRMAVITDSSYTKFMIGEDFNLWNPDDKHFKKVDSLMIKAIEAGDFYFLKNKTISEIRKYYRQYLCYINEKGENIIFINSMCNLSDYQNDDNLKSLDWEKEMLKIADGGDCYWSIKINLTQEKYFDLRVNTEG